jgi:hypothetical protein
MHVTIHDGVTVDRVVVTAIDVIDGPQAEVASTHTGLLTQPGLPSEVTLALKKSGQRRGAQYRGRFFTWPGNAAALDPTDPNLFTGAYVTLCVESYNGLLTALAGNGTPLCIASFTYGGLYDVATILATDQLVDHQDRRAAGRGR